MASRYNQGGYGGGQGGYQQRDNGGGYGGGQRDNGGGYGGGQRDYGGGQQRNDYQGGGGGRGRGGRGGNRGGDRGGRGGGRGGDGGQDVQLDNRRERTKIRDDMEKIFKDQQIPEGDSILEDKMAPGTVSKATESFHTNAFGVAVDKFPLHQYHIEMSAFRPGRVKKAILFTKRSNDDYVATDRKTRCRDVFNIIKEMRPDIFHPDTTFYYDLQSTLMATTKLKTDTPENLIRVDFDPSRFPRYISVQSFAEVNVIIKKSETDTDLTSDDMTMARLKDLTEFDRGHQRFIELATSQFALFHPTDVVCLAGGKMYLCAPQNSMENSLVERCNKFSSDKFLGIGCKKSAKYIEGPKGRGHENVALFIGPIKTPFFREQTILAFLEGRRFNVTDRSKYTAMTNTIRNLYVYNPLLGGKRTFQIIGLARESARTMTFPLREGGETNVMQYFYEKYKVQLRYPDVPLVKGKGKTDLLPMEYCVIDDNQPAPKNRMNQYEDADMVKISALPPATQKKEVRGFLSALGLNDLVKERDGIQMRPHLTITGRILQNPEITYANDKTVVPADDGLWKLPGKFIRSGESFQWGLIRYGNAIDVKMREFQTAYFNMCRTNGVLIPEKPLLVGRVDDRGLEHFFVEGKRLKIDFLVVISDLSIDMQGDLKCLERKYEIATQNVTAKVANDAAARGTATLENIVQKTNPKLGGTNYTIRHRQKFIDDAFGKNCLIIGIALSHSGSIDDVQRARGGVAVSTALSAVGYAANTGIDPYEFIGDHLPNNPHRSEILDLIPGIIQSTINKFNENRGMFPSTMILYLNGSSEGDFVLLKRFEVPLVFKKMNDIIGRKIPLTVIVPQRSNVARVYKTNPNPADKPAKQNIQPGVVIDTGLVHPTLNEFFLNSHTTIQGTARTPKYTILHNDNVNAGMDAIQHMTYYLCFGHQIVNSPTSLPSPVYVASAYAERGTKMYKSMAKNGENPNPEDIAERWIYDTSVFFRNKRINA
uniref:Uncharacterized protein n=1 Tax=Panagrolaimus sp. ES5 TaxID=591445 RepID=A0AC34GR82_9BILA